MPAPGAPTDFPLAIWHIWAHLIFERAKYGQVEYPSKDLAKCNSHALTLCQYLPPIKSYDEFLIAIKMQNFKVAV